MIDRIIAAQPGQAEQYRGGKEGLLGFFVGQVMKETGGKADARVVNERVQRKLEALAAGATLSIARHISSVVPSPQSDVARGELLRADDRLVGLRVVERAA